jgi:hypothetical protein
LVSTPVKKKDLSVSEQSQPVPAKAMGSSSADGSLGTPPTVRPQKKLTQEDLENISNTDIKDMSGKVVFSKAKQEEAKKTLTRISEEKKVLESEKKKYSDVFDRQLKIKPKPAESQYLNDRLASINTSLINKTEEYVVPEMEYQFGDLGFKFEETGAMGDYMKVTAPNGKTIEVSLDNFLSSKSSKQAETLKSFIKTNAPAKGLFVLENTLREQDKKFNSQKDVDNSIKSITKEVNDLNQRQKQFLAKTESLEKEVEEFGNTEEIEKKRLALMSEMKSLLSEEEKIKARGQRLNAAVAKYGISEAKKGGWSGGIWDSFNRGIGKMTSGITSLISDVQTEIMPAGYGMSPKDLKNVSIDIAKKIGVTPPSEKQSVEEWKKTLTEDQLDQWEDEVDDVIKKDIKGRVLPYVRIGAEEIFGDPETTKQWSDLKKESFWGGAILGLSESLPAMIGGSGPAGWAQRTAQMYAQVSDGVMEEMEKDPDFANISENEKLAVTLPIGITSAVLEAYGLRNVLASKGVINSITMSVLGRAGANTSARTFRELVENEVESKLAKGLLTVTAAGIAEFETGAAQELSESTFKSVYNKIKEKNMFNTPDSKMDLLENVLVAGAQEAVGGFILGVPTGVSTAYSEKGFLKMDDITFTTFENMANDDKMQSAYIANLKQQIAQGIITVAQGKEQLNNYRNSVGLFRQLPDGLTTEQKKEAMNLLKEKRDLETYVNGKDAALVVKQKNRITEINDSLTKLSETNAIQEQSTAAVPVQPETGVSETVEEGVPQPKTEVVTEKSTEEEIADIEKEIEDYKEDAYKRDAEQEVYGYKKERDGNQVKGNFFIGNDGVLYKRYDFGAGGIVFIEEDKSKAYDDLKRVNQRDVKSSKDMRALTNNEALPLVLENVRKTEVRNPNYFNQSLKDKYDKLEELKNKPEVVTEQVTEEEVKDFDLKLPENKNNISVSDSSNGFILIDSETNQPVEVFNENAGENKGISKFYDTKEQAEARIEELKSVSNTGVYQYEGTTYTVTDNGITSVDENGNETMYPIEKIDEVVSKGEKISESVAPQTIITEQVAEPQDVLLGQDIAEQLGLPPAPEGLDIVSEPAPVVETPAVADLLELDTTDKTKLQRVLDYLDKADSAWDLDPNELNDVTRVMAATTAKAVIKALKVLVNAGITLQEAIKRVSAEQKVTPDQIIEAMNIVSKINENKAEGVSEFDLPGYNRMVGEIEGIIEKSKKRRVSADKIADNVMSYVMGSKVYEDATDVQREALVREVRKRFGLKEKSAPSVGKLFGKIKDIKKITMTEKDALIKQIKDTAKGAKDAISASRRIADQLSKDVKELASSGKITAKQAANIISKMSKVNVFNDASVSNFVDYMSKVFADAEYDNKINVAKSKLKKALKNTATKLGMADGLIGPMQTLFSVNPNMIPIDKLNRYLELVDMMSERSTVLSLEEISTVTRDVQSILDEINNERSLAESLAYRFNYSQNIVVEDGKINYAASLKKMVENGDITQDEADIMTKYKKIIFPQVSDSGMTEQEIEDEKQVLVREVRRANVDANTLPSRLQRGLAKKIAMLTKSQAIKKLSNTDLKNLLKVIDNINNGYLPHYAELIAEKIESIEDSETGIKAVKKAKFPALSTLYAKAKSKITKKDFVLEMIRRNPMDYIDQVFGNFRTKDLYNSILKKSAEAQAKFEYELKNVQERLSNAENKIAKSFSMDPNKTLMSKFKIMTYMIQLEYESNPDNKQVNPASQYIAETIKKINRQKTKFGDSDAKMLEKIMEDYSVDGEIDIQKLYDSFNSAEKEAIRTIIEINESLAEKAAYTAAVIRGQKMSPLNNYIHLNVISDDRGTDLASGASFADSYNNSLRPSTKAKSLIERTPGAKALNFDVFTSVHQGSKYVLMDYHLTAPIRTARKTMNRVESEMEDSGTVTKEQRKVMNAINDAFEEAVDRLISNSYMETSIGEDVADEISRQGYRSILAGTGRFVGEFLSNVGFVVINDPFSFMEGLRYKDVIMSDSAAQIMSNVNSKEINRIFPSETLSGRLIDTNILSQANGIRGGVSKGFIRNKAEQVWNLTGKKYKNAVELTSDVLISTPDKIIMRPFWFGSFASKFEEITGRKIDFEKIANNDEAYMDANKEAIEEAKNSADQKSVIMGASNNAFTGLLKGGIKPNQSPYIRAFNNFNNFMTRFLIYEYVSARTGIMAAIGNGSMSRKEGVALLAAVTTRMTVYSLMTKALGSGLIGLLFGDDDDDEEKSLDKTAGQALVSSFTSLAFGRDFGNATKTIVNYGLERINEEHLGFLREGEYDPYKDAIQFTAVPVDKKGEQTDLFDYYKNFTGAFGPSVKTLDLIVKTYSDKEKKEASAIERQERVKSERIPLEVLGNLGYVPLYKEIRKELLKDIYKDLDKKKETDTDLTTEELDEVNTLNDLLETERDSKTKRVIKRKLNEILYNSKEDKEAKKALKKKLLNGYKNQEDLKRYDRETWEKNFGENSKWYKENEPEREVNKKLEEIKRAKMDEEYNYIETSEEDYKFGPQKKKSGGYKFGAQ